MCMLLIAGGHETTAKLIANGVRLFGSPPASNAPRCVADPELMPQAVEELLRFTSPTQFMTRTTTRDVEVRGRVHPRRAPRWRSSSARATATPASSSVRTSSTSSARTRASSRSGTVRTCASAPRSLGSRAGSPSRSSSTAFPSYDVDESGISYMHSGNVQGPHAHAAHRRMKGTR